jgi:hypothetical protein
LSTKRDHQRGRVYAWENRVVAPHDPSFVAFPEAQAMVNAIWSEMGLLYPPKVEPLAKHAKATIATATRLCIRLPERLPSWCLLHEIAHAITATAEGWSDGHGAAFMGVYVRLLARYLRLESADLVRTAREDHIKVADDARPAFADA